MGNHVNPPRFGKPSRKCHDCGKKTNDYRCAKCLAKWRAKHGVMPADVENGNFFTSYAPSGGRVSSRSFGE